MTCLRVNMSTLIGSGYRDSLIRWHVRHFWQANAHYWSRPPWTIIGKNLVASPVAVKHFTCRWMLPCVSSSSSSVRNGTSTTQLPHGVRLHIPIRNNNFGYIRVCYEQARSCMIRAHDRVWYLEVFARYLEILRDIMFKLLIKRKVRYEIKIIITDGGWIIT